MPHQGGSSSDRQAWAAAIAPSVMYESGEMVRWCRTSMHNVVKGRAIDRTGHLAADESPRGWPAAATAA